MKKPLTLLVAILFVFLLPLYASAAEVPNVDGLAPEDANVLIEQYNQELKEEYDAEVERVEAANAEEIARQEQSEEAVAAAEAQIEKFEAKKLDTFTEDSADLPTNWEGETTEAPKTIQIEEGVNEDLIRYLNIHIYFGEDFQATSNVVSNITDTEIEYSDETLDNMLFGEYELVETPTDSFVTTISESEAMGYRSAAFYRKLPGFTNGYWMPLWSENYATAAWSMGTWYKGSAYEMSYIDGTTDRRDPTNPLSVFTYGFVRTGAEPELYTAQLEDLPQEPEYMELLEIVEPEPQPEPTPDPEPTPEPQPEPTPIPEPIPTPQPEPQPTPTAEPMIVITPVEEEEEETPIVEEERTIEEEEVIIEENLPLVGMMGHWAVVNLILSILAALFILVRTHKKNLMAKVLVIVLSALVFIFTEDWTLPMVWFDKWTYVHFGLAWVQLLLCRKEEEKEEDEEEEE